MYTYIQTGLTHEGSHTHNTRQLPIRWFSLRYLAYIVLHYSAVRYTALLYTTRLVLSFLEHILLQVFGGQVLSESQRHKDVLYTQLHAIPHMQIMTERLHMHRYLLAHVLPAVVSILMLKSCSLRQVAMQRSFKLVIPWWCKHMDSLAAQSLGLRMHRPKYPWYSFDRLLNCPSSDIYKLMILWTHGFRARMDLWTHGIWLLKHYGDHPAVEVWEADWQAVPREGLWRASVLPPTVDSV